MTQRKIDKLTIRGFRSIQNLEEFPLSNLNILIGANGVGKSNFVSYFRMLRELVEKRLRLWINKQGGADRFLTYGVKKTNQLFSEIFFGDYGYKFALEPTVDDELIFAAETFYNLTTGGFLLDKDDHIIVDEQIESSDDRFEHRLGAGHIESKLKSNTTYRMSRYVYDSIASWQVFHVHDTGDTSPMLPWRDTADYAFLRPDASNIAPFLYHLKQKFPRIYSEIIRVVRMVVPFFDDFLWQPRELSPGEEQIRLLWKQIDSDYVFQPSQLSDGSLRFICLVTALLQPNPPATIIIDEPELGLHPYALTILGALIRSVSTEVQLIVATQSVTLVNEFTPEDVIVVEREKGVSVFRRLSSEELKDWLEDYTLGELWEKNIVGGTPA